MHPFWQGAIDFLLPPRCPVSGDIVSHDGLCASHIWSALDFIAAPFCQRCGVPFDFSASQGDAQCDLCQENPPVYYQARSAMIYNDVARQMILAFKHGDQAHLASAFVPWLLQAGREMLDQADYLIPVPLHYWRQVKRRYNQSLLISRALGASSQVPVMAKGLVRHRSTPSQGGLSAAARMDNVKDAFRVLPSYETMLAGKKVILVDDVYTTGATVQACSRALLDAGAAQINVLSLARVLSSGHNRLIQDLGGKTNGES